MRKLAKKIISFLLSASLLVSTIGINLSVHTCNAAGTRDVSIHFMQVDHSSDEPCSVCDTPEAKLCCVEEIAESDCCSKDKPHHALPTVKKDKCCDEFSELIQAQYEIETCSNVSIPDALSFTEIACADCIIVKAAPEQTKEIQSHVSGIPPPYSSTYLYYISSVRE